MLKQRVITAIILVLITVPAILWLPEKWFAAVSLGVILSLVGWEWSRMVPGSELERTGLVLGLIGIGLVIWLLGLNLYAIIVGVVWWFVILGLLSVYKQGSGFYRDRSWLLKVSAFLVLIPAWLSIAKLQAFDPAMVFYLVFLVAATDIGAYFVGKALGQHKLAPELSPGKTKEGVKGGLACALVWALAGSFYFGFSRSAWVYFMLLSLLVACLSVAGDLFESLIKREAGKKDSGTLLAGHGGFFDRLDGLLAALPVFALGLHWLTQGGGH